MVGKIPTLHSSKTRNARQVLSWGRYPRVQHSAVHQPTWQDQIDKIFCAISPSKTALPFGVGRSYGDSCLNSEAELIDCSGLDRILGFDLDTGVIHCEAGLTIADLLEIIVPLKWFVPVTPGTKYVTLGGAVANDVHGKNHHRAGTIGNHVRSLTLSRSDCSSRHCSPGEDEDLFTATIGGLGLTGVITQVEMQLKRIDGPFMSVENVPFKSFGDFVRLSEESDAGFEYTVAWVDCLSRKLRGVFFRGNHSSDVGKDAVRRWKPRVPFPLPSFILNPYATTAFNKLYYWSNSRLSARQHLRHYDPFFYPLDGIHDWNLMYGSNGFLQYQFVVDESKADAIEEVFHLVSNSGLGSFLAVLKKFGKSKSPGMMSFARPGFTLAMDFPMRGQRLLDLLQKLDDVVIKNGGAVYPAKDARMSMRVFDSSFPMWRDFSRFIDPKLSSSFWRRVTGGNP